MIFSDERTNIDQGAAAVIVYPDIGHHPMISHEERLLEAEGLARAIGINVVEMRAYRLRTIKPGILFGGGQLDEIASIIAAHSLKLLIVDGALSAIQQRNLEERLKVKVIDRTGLILEVFGERAATQEGRLQVELAHLDYQAGRLVRSWTHLERQRGGYGFLGGPGETQIESDRRMLNTRRAKLRRELGQVIKTRTLHRSRRQREGRPLIALVGYTNAGKSTLFNRLTDSDVMAKDMLFATLDPTLRAIELPSFGKAMMSDTVGFVSDLPTQLIAAFRATLEEVLSADIIVHVRDISHPLTFSQKDDVETVLAEIGVDLRDEDNLDGTPLIELWNKTDLLDEDRRAELTLHAQSQTYPVELVSAINGDGVDKASNLMSALLTEGHHSYKVSLDHKEGEALAWLYRHGTILNDYSDEQYHNLIVRMENADWSYFRQKLKNDNIIMDAA
ncbi:GTPase HflX [Parasphingorhabdus sp. DH2-15]|uniref:GTPase HflX n=1 Tax=Parasphingorhabdus sp. DH2-15 TaxID=3444112 RepID=UPI003F68703A